MVKAARLSHLCFPFTSSFATRHSPFLSLVGFGRIRLDQAEPAVVVVKFKVQGSTFQVQGLIRFDQVSSIGPVRISKLLVSSILRCESQKMARGLNRRGAPPHALAGLRPSAPLARPASPLAPRRRSGERERERGSFKLRSPECGMGLNHGTHGTHERGHEQTLNLETRTLNLELLFLIRHSPFPSLIGFGRIQSDSVGSGGRIVDGWGVDGGWLKAARPRFDDSTFLTFS